MKTLVTGGRGMVGSHFSENCIKLGRGDYDLRRMDNVLEMIRKYNPRKVIHLAAKVGGLYDNMANQATYFNDNFQMNYNIIRACNLLNVPDLTVMLSTCIFPHEHHVLDVNDIHGGEPHPTNYGYAYSKRMAEVMIRAHNDQYGSNYKVVIPTNIYGEGDNFNLNTAHVIPALVHKFFKAQRFGEKVIIKGDGSAIREFVYAPDVAKILEGDYEHKAVISSGKGYRIFEVVELLKSMSKVTDVEYDYKSTNGQHIKQTQNQHPFDYTPLEVGLKRTWDWFSNNYDKARK